MTFEVVSVGGDGNRAAGTEDDGALCCACCCCCCCIAVLGIVDDDEELPTAEFATAAANPTICVSCSFISSCPPILLEEIADADVDVGAAGRAGGAMLQLLAMN